MGGEGVSPCQLGASLRGMRDVYGGYISEKLLSMVGG